MTYKRHPFIQALFDRKDIMFSWEQDRRTIAVLEARCESAEYHLDRKDDLIAAAQEENRINRVIIEGYRLRDESQKKLIKALEEKLHDREGTGSGQ